MAKEVFTRTWCDLCLGNEERREAVQTDLVFTIHPLVKPTSLDLCQKHLDHWVTPLVQVLEEHGGPPPQREPSERGAGRPSKGDGPFRCEVCEKVLKSRGSFGSHCRDQHGFGLTEYVERYGEPVQVDPSEYDGPDRSATATEWFMPAEATCTECGKVYSHAKGNKRPLQAVGVHMARKHGITAEMRRQQETEQGQEVLVS